MEENKKAKEQDIWNDEEFLKELDRRIEEFESGKVEGITWEELKAKTTKSNR